MGDIRGSNISKKFGIDNKALQKEVNNYTAYIAKLAVKAGEKAMLDLRTSAVEKWYNTSGAESMNKATKCESKMKQNKRNITIEVTSYVDLAEFEYQKKRKSGLSWFGSPYDNLARWRERHEKDGWTYYNRGEHWSFDNSGNFLGNTTVSRTAINMPYSIPEYLFYLPWYEGIKGLPPRERYTDTGWINPAKQKNAKGRDKGILKTYVENQINKRWKKAVQEEFDRIMK